jgi:aerobic-type carbon monoxide dehydrogenase small subunit (CoxS/CutS family)
MKHIEFTINGRHETIEVAPSETLLEMIRERLNLTGTKEGCGMGECGACTVIMDGVTVNSCLVLAAEADGKSIVTIEGVGSREKLHPVQESFVKHGGSQCGFCTPGMVVSGTYLLKKYPRPTEEQIREGIAGNFCRCTGYTKIVESIEAASKMMSEGGES